MNVHFVVRLVNNREYVERREVFLGRSLEDGLVVIDFGLKEDERIAVPRQTSNTLPKY